MTPPQKSSSSASATVDRAAADCAAAATDRAARLAARRAAGTLAPDTPTSTTSAPSTVGSAAPLPANDGSATIADADAATVEAALHSLTQADVVSILGDLNVSETSRPGSTEVASRFTTSTPIPDVPALVPNAVSTPSTRAPRPPPTTPGADPMLSHAQQRKAKEKGKARRDLTFILATSALLVKQCSGPYRWVDGAGRHAARLPPPQVPVL
ncbi:hypothetical protein DFH08DRAFT_1012924 [Mycena albidolilacea]|uniref:Uncharacterized protein n=1 Tax=Mycena albidolilacea TaxID=1033008 RepID=A0AAD7ENJ3_9AGAR|nr:hypothetical protein DFH08DRAFT_1012924 [Mycena albidolilacea]